MRVPIGTYEYGKWYTRLMVAVCIMEVLHEEDSGQEARSRERRWTSVGEAAALLTGHPVRTLLDRARDLLRDGVA